MSENERQSQTLAVINDKLQGAVVTYLSCGGIFNNHIEKSLLQSLPVIFFKSVNIWHSYGQEGGLCHALTAVWWPDTQSARDNHLLTCNFAKCSPM